jgi:hypothetical protein
MPPLSPLRRNAIRALALAASVLACGCASIRVEGGTVQTTGAFAPIFVRPDPAQPLTVIWSEGLGWVPHGDGVTLGYHREIRATVSDLNACQLLVLDTGGDPAAFQRLIDILAKSSAHLCTIPKEPS